MDTLKLFTVEEIRNLLVKWWCLYKTLETDANTNNKFMILAYMRTFEVMSLATLMGERDIDIFVEAVEKDSAARLLDTIDKRILAQYPKEDDFIQATASMVLRLKSLPFDSKPLFGSFSR